ncbi:MAG: hypothetical protein EOQ31_31550 [Mesorhizobium sp.]|uniref:hypothetical protein n=1 Tax=Mesorhizobium sp. TaxID=1871066 RepID=UPI000FE8EA91|nr:hypothetical protein [Mesorhizobium sp.]RWA81482.1 MAG: hypothetical protein EOQ31_31550 [Mesorhizobium sp.]
MTITAADLVNREVGHCVSYLVSTLGAAGAYQPSRDMSDLAEQAFELAMPIEDWEEAAREAGWYETRDGWQHDGADDGEAAFANTAQGACEMEGVDPYQRDVFEHWIVSDWLADKLIEKGEKVDKDFAGLCVWARTTTGQGIASDWVIEQIHADLVKG